ncbi:MAG: PaaI family thioesterase [Acidimicrobiales bacterium]
MIRTADLDGVVLDEAIDSLRSVTGELRAHRVDGVRMQSALDFGRHQQELFATVAAGVDGVDEYARRGTHDPDEFFPYSPVVGRLNPLSPPARMWRAEGPAPDGPGEVHGEVTFGAAFNGPPGSVHGGVIAETFDELLGCVCVVNGLGAFTGTLTVVYRSTTPLDRPVRLRGWLSGTERRKVFARGTLHDGDTLCAEAEGVFIRSDQLPGGGVPVDAA